MKDTSTKDYRQVAKELLPEGGKITFTLSPDESAVLATVTEQAKGKIERGTLHAVVLDTKTAEKQWEAKILGGVVKWTEEGMLEVFEPKEVNGPHRPAYLYDIKERKRLGSEAPKKH